MLYLVDILPANIYLVYDVTLTQVKNVSDIFSDFEWLSL